MGFRILAGDCRETLKTLPENSVHCCVTSPPYFNQRDYECDGQIGLESTPEEFVEQMVQVFREVRRVLRSDGTLWLNLGDSYAGSRSGSLSGSTLEGSTESQKEFRKVTSSKRRDRKEIPRTDLRYSGYKPKDLIGIPWMVAFALRHDGWYLRQEIIWHKPNPMPESVTDRCTKSHEHIFLMAKSDRYYFDAEAIKERSKREDSGNKQRKSASERGVPVNNNGTTNGAVAGSVPWSGLSRNKRDVWTVGVNSFKGAHFATFPPNLIEPCIRASTSEIGCCPDCGAQWQRQVERQRVATRPGTKSKVHETDGGKVVGNRDPLRHVTKYVTTGWKPSCDCGYAQDQLVQPTVLDPFNGAGTTGFVAQRFNCDYIGCELNPEYIKLTSERLRSLFN